MPKFWGAWSPLPLVQTSMMMVMMMIADRVMILALGDSSTREAAGRLAATVAV